MYDFRETAGRFAPSRRGFMSGFASLALGASVPIVLYTGTFEAYQGLDLLYEAMRVVQRKRPDARSSLSSLVGRPDLSQLAPSNRRPSSQAARVA